MNIDDVVMVKATYTKWLSDHADEMHQTVNGIVADTSYKIDKFSYTKGLPLVGIIVRNASMPNTYFVEYSNGLYKGSQVFEKKDLIKLA